MDGRKVILFGAGQLGRKALAYFGVENVHCFADNNAKLAGGEIEHVPVISFEQLKAIYREYHLVLSMDISNSMVASVQLEEAGIREYTLFLKILERDSGGQAAASSSEINAGKRGSAGKNVLMITYQFPPMAGSGVFRSLKFVKYLPQFGWNPIVFAADRPRVDWAYMDQSLLAEIPDGVDVIRITDPVGSLQELSLLEKRDFLLPFLHEVLRGDPEAETVFSSFLKTRTGTAEILTFPCAALFWAYQVVRYIEQNLDIQNIQAVYTTSDPYSAHLVGFYLKSKYGMPWLADYRDPWTGNFIRPLDLTKPRGKLLGRLELILLKQADCSITVDNEEIVRDYTDRFSLEQGKIISITNGYDEDDYTGLKTAKETTDFFIINYCGLMHSNAKIDVVLEALKQLADERRIEPALVRVRLVGESRQYDPEAAAKKFGLDSILIETGYVSHREAIRSNLDADLLFLPTGNGESVKATTASKMYDYLRSGRPILAFSAKDGEIDRVLRETGHGEAFRSTQVPEIKAMILREYQKWRSGQAVPPLHSPKIERFERKALTGRLAELLENVGRTADSAG